MSLAGLAKCGRSKDMGGEGFAPTKVFDPTNKLESVGAAPPPTTWAHTHTLMHTARHYTTLSTVYVLSNVPSDASNLLRLASAASPISGYLWENADHPTTSRWIFAPPNHLTNNQTLPKHLTKRFPTNLLGKHEMAHHSNFPLDFLRDIWAQIIPHYDYIQVSFSFQYQCQRQKITILRTSVTETRYTSSRI